MSWDITKQFGMDNDSKDTFTTLLVKHLNSDQLANIKYFHNSIFQETPLPFFSKNSQDLEPAPKQGGRCSIFGINPFSPSQFISIYILLP